jgi:acyl-CoA dehydrogenase
MLTLDEDQTLLMDSARAAVASHAPISQYRKLRAPAGEGFSREFWKLAAEMGWTGVLIREEFGGVGFGVVGAGLVAREMARTLALSPFLSTAVLAASALAEGASEAQKAEWLPRIVAAETILALAVDEGARPAASYVTTAKRTPAGFRLDGEKHFVIDGHVAAALIVAAAYEGNASLFLVDAQSRGLSRQTRILVDGRRVATIRLDGVEVPEAARLPGGALAFERTLVIGRAVLAAALCGVAEEAFRRTLDYLKERRQFDRRIGSFQALQHRAALAHIAVENAWSATLKALQSLDARANGAAFDVAVAKSKASRMGEDVTAECLQMHGGIGMTDAFDIGLYLKRARVDSVLFGDAAYHADRVASLLGY